MVKGTPSHEPTDDELVERCQKGDRQAFEQIVRRHQQKVYNIAYGIVKNREDALDIAQETFVKVYASLSRFRGASSFATWLHRIVVNLCFDFHRRSGKGQQLEYRDDILSTGQAGDPPAAKATSQPLRQLMMNELGEVIQSAIDDLPPAQRTAIVLREVEGLPYKEIAEVLGCSKGTVMSRLHYARQKLQETIGPYLE